MAVGWLSSGSCRTWFDNSHLIAETLGSGSLRLHCGRHQRNGSIAFLRSRSRDPIDDLSAPRIWNNSSRYSHLHMKAPVANCGKLWRGQTNAVFRALLQGTCFHCFDWDAGPKPNQLTEDHWLILQKEEEELAIRPILPWDVPLRRDCAHCPMHPEKAKKTSSHNGRVRPDTTQSPVTATLLPPKPRANFDFSTDFPHTLGLCP